MAKCTRCNIEVYDGAPGHRDKDGFLCWSCTYITGLITEADYLEFCGVYLSNMHASIRDGKVIVWNGKIPPWEERSDRQERHTQKYKEWRTAVFTRDQFTCQQCGQVGGELNAHHIKPFSIYKRVRYKSENGITLCKVCHRKEHRKKEVS